MIHMSVEFLKAKNWDLEISPRPQMSAFHLPYPHCRKVPCACHGKRVTVLSIELSSLGEHGVQSHFLETFSHFRLEVCQLQYHQCLWWGFLQLSLPPPKHTQGCLLSASKSGQVDSGVKHTKVCFLLYILFFL